MPIFEWQGKSVTGEVRKGALEAPNPQLVEVYLRRLNIVPIKIQPKKRVHLEFLQENLFQIKILQLLPVNLQLFWKEVFLL